MSDNIASPVGPNATPADKMERKCRQAWYDQYHKVRPQISYKDWRTVWFACLERVGIDSTDPDQKSRFDDANESLDSLEIHFPGLDESFNFGIVRGFFAGVFA